MADILVVYYSATGSVRELAKSVARGEADGPKGAQAILTHPLVGVADRAHEPSREILTADCPKRALAGTRQM